MSISKLTHHRSAIPILAELARTGGSRFVPLVARVGASREAVRQALDLLGDIGLVMPNPGYGHPSRPEYVLADGGRDVARACESLVDELRRRGIEDVCLKKWTLPVLVELDSEHRFGQLSAVIDTSPRALSLALKDLVAVGLVERRVHDGYPPSSSYLVTTEGRFVRRTIVWLDRELRRRSRSV